MLLLAIAKLTLPRSLQRREAETLVGECARGNSAMHQRIMRDGRASERERERGASLVRFRRALGASFETLADIPLAVARATVFRFRDDDAARAHARLQHIVRIACLFRDPESREVESREDPARSALGRAKGLPTRAQPRPRWLTCAALFVFQTSRCRCRSRL